MNSLAIVGPGGRLMSIEYPPRNRRRTDPGHRHVSNIRPSNIIVQRPGGPLYDWADDCDLNDDLTPPHGIERVDVAGWVRSELG